MNESIKPAKGLQGEPTRRIIFFSLRWKLLIGFTLVFSVVFAAAFLWFYQFATQQALNRIQADLLDTLSGGTKSVSVDILIPLAETGEPNELGQIWLEVSNADENETPDAEALKTAALEKNNVALQEGFSADPRYQTLMDELAAIHEIEPRAWPYVYVKAEGERRITYIADLWARYEPSKAVPFGFTRISNSSYKGLNKRIIRLDDNDRFTPYKDEWGQWVSAYMPILDENGESVGAMGIDFEADYVREVQEAIQDRVAMAFIITYLALFILVFFISRTLTNPISELTEAAERLGEGDYEQDLSKLGSSGFLNDEIDTLARVFAIMTSKVYRREQNLRKQVKELQIEIDQTKRKKQVDEIADTDFFKDLQSKARNMRDRNEKE
ncbi:MAG: HAMP domain-containing protein [Anaerolineales bacterium]|nr:HAMP domain-containing protein [Anaerolineales bacterium]